MRRFLFLGSFFLFLFMSSPARADSVFQVTLSNITFAPLNSNPEVINASFFWDVTSATAYDFQISSGPLVFVPDAAVISTGTPLPSGSTDVVYLNRFDFGHDSYGDILQILNDYGPSQALPDIAATYDLSQTRIGQVFFSCGQDCQTQLGIAGGNELALGGVITVSNVPEPASLLLLGIGLAAVLPLTRRTRIRRHP